MYKILEPQCESDTISDLQNLNVELSIRLEGAEEGAMKQPDM